MYDFWTVLTNLIQQYSIADTANVFSIIEGAATAVAAVGAIFAVIVTVRIAKNQNALFVEQNKISAAQADISKQQNRIALFDKRANVFKSVREFFDVWVAFGGASLETLKETPVNLFIAYVYCREFKMLDVEFLKSKDWQYFQNRISVYMDEDLYLLVSILRLFTLTIQEMDFVGRIITKYEDLNVSIRALVNAECPTDTFEKNIKDLHEEATSALCEELISDIMSQCVIGRC